MEFLWKTGKGKVYLHKNVLKNSIENRENQTWGHTEEKDGKVEVKGR